MTFTHVRRGVALMVALPLWLTGTSASAQNRADRPGSDTGTTAVARPSSPAPAPAPAPAPGPAATPADRGGRSGSDAGGGGTTPAVGDTGSGRRRERAGDPVVGRAEPRPASGRPTDGGTVILVPDGLYPWGYGGFGFGGYYGGYYDPGYGYPGGGGYPTYTPSQRGPEGAVRIKVTPREASVYADGYFVGHVDDFDGLLQKLRLSEGPHRIEIRDPKYETLTFDVRIDTDQTITYRGEMKKI